MTSTPHARPWTRSAGVVGIAVLLLGGGAAAATTEDRSTLPTGTVEVEGQQTPIEGSFVYHQFHTDTNPEIRGLVHGVHRVDGATVLYYSVGTPDGGGATDFTGAMAFPNSSHPYRTGFGVDLKLIDSTNLVAYRPLYDGETTFASRTVDLDGGTGDLRVGFAVFPEIDPTVDAVQVVMAWGTAVGDVAVQDGPLEPVGSDAAPLLGEGWPAIPSAADLSGADPAAVTYSLVRRFGDASGTAATEETPEQVATTLDANVLFAVSSADLSPAAQDALAAVAADIRQRGTGEVVVTGHTDSDGADASNQVLSEQRAASVLAVLEPASGSDVTFTAVGRGESEPVASNATDEGKQLNRRVTVVYSVKGDS
ncbi:OmpA family protein [Actinotalea sp. K2]|uniref:OmpA family protein n=1 Tax=Actinotalea sp. K2 TaxID=2939438 RepID=UPI002017CEAA|nr:OmpA family protein [Actinotalea sp. K2]MCL3859932.1 OmpA family protein [Actinotalea sp. K2]